MKILILCVFLVLGLNVLAATKAATKAPVSAPTKSTTTEHNFEDMLVQGKFHFSDEAVTTVEDDKVLDSLIGVRTDFKDRLKMSASQY